MKKAAAPVYTGLIAVILAATLLASKLTDHRRPDKLAQPLERIPSRLGDWAASGTVSLPEAVEKKLAATEFLERTYRRGTDSLDLLIAYYSEQRAGESMHSPKNCLPGGGWEIWNYGTAEVPVGAKRITVNSYSIQKDSTRALMLYWYQTPQRIVAGEYEGKAFLLWDALTRGLTSGSIVRILVPDRPGALQDLTRVATLVIPAMDRCLRLNPLTSSLSMPLDSSPLKPSSVLLDPSTL